LLALALFNHNENDIIVMYNIKLYIAATNQYYHFIFDESKLSHIDIVSEMVFL